jgi:prepilin-type processing-associated H-X9-DG protein
LIELLVVISITSLLIAILLPALQKARESAVSISCMNNMHQMAMTMNMYLNDNNETFPPRYIKVSTPSNGKYYWNDLLKRYVNEDVPVSGSSPNGWFQDASPLPAAFKCPKLSAAEAWSTAYSGIGYNNDGLAQDVVIGSWVHLSMIAQTSKILVAADAQTTLANPGTHPPVVGFNRLNLGNLAAYRHPNASANAFFVDGHAQKVHVEELGTSWSTFYQKYPWMEKWF